jgi:phytoene dehydrogenase-like protein
MALICSGHAVGWPVAKGGSGAIAGALSSVLAAHGGKVETGVRVTSLSQLPPADAVFFDLAPSAVAEIAADRLPTRVRRAFRRFKHGPGAFKLDLAIEGGVPWTSESCRRAGTVHVIGSFEETVFAEREINRGRMPERPVVLVGQQYLADPTRSDVERGLNPVWAYAHVPSGFTGDATETILDQIERFAPGLRERIRARAIRTTHQVEQSNANYIGGDILTGANTPIQTVIRPRLSLNPYSCGIDGLYICSAATPPGPGAHGMCGFNAAQLALERL